MKEKLKEIIEHYGVMKQLKYFQSEVFELNEAIIKYEYADDYMNDKFVLDIAQEIADVEVMLNQFKEYYNIKDKPIEDIMRFKIDRQLERIKNEEK
jgi:hypothetical protein